MEHIVETDETAFNRRSALEIAELIKKKADIRICFATGATTKGIYHELADLHRHEGLDFSQVTAFVLDEYEGASADNPASCLARLNDQLFDRVNMKKSNISSIASTSSDLHQVSKEYEEHIGLAGGIDLMLLGIGTNGHIGFNEPGSPFHSTTRVVPIGEDTIHARANMFGSRENVPKTGVTMGIKTIMNSRQIFLFAKGVNKAVMLEKALFGPITQDIPASVLQLHPALTVIADEEAASGLPHRSMNY